MKHNTPILSAVRRMHAEDDKRPGFDPYNTLVRSPPAAAPGAKREAEQVLACYETTLTIQE